MAESLDTVFPHAPWAREKQWLIAFFCAAAVLYGVGMTRTAFEGKDERRYVRVGKEIGWGKDLVVMRYIHNTHRTDNPGGLYPDKPPVFFWAEAVSFRLFGGVSPGAARFPLLLSALAALAFAYALMRQIDGPRKALLGVAILALSFRFVWAGRWIKLDMPMCAFTFAAFWCATRVLFPNPGQKAAGLGWALAAWAFAALAGLSKGPGGIVFLCFVFVFAAVTRDLSVLRRMRVVPGLLLVVAIVAAWMVPAAMLGGKDYMGPMLGTHVVERIGGLVRHEEPFWYFFAMVIGDAAPMGLFLPAALWLAWRRRGTESDGGRTRFLLTWLFFTLLFFSIPKGKRSQYILPLYPAVALLTARLFWTARSTDAGVVGRVVRWHLAVLFVLGLAAGIGVQFAPEGLSEEFPAAPSLVARLGWLLALTGGGVLGLWALWRRKTPMALAFAGASFYLSLVVAFGAFFPLCRDDSVPRQIAKEVAENNDNGLAVGIYDVDVRYTLYGDIDYEMVTCRDEARDFLAGGERRLLVTTEKKHAGYVRVRGAPPWKEISRWDDAEAEKEIILFASF